MGGLFGVVSKNNCVQDLFYGTDYHSHLGTKRGGLAVTGRNGFTRIIHNIENTPFRTKFEEDIRTLKGNMGIGVISDFDDQPLIIGSHLGTYGIVTVGRINNLSDLVNKAFRKGVHFSEMSRGMMNPTELVATLINEGSTFEEGIRNAQEQIDGSCSLLILTGHGIYAARDRYGRTPVIIGEKEGSYAVTFETCAFPNLGFRTRNDLGAGEILLVTPDAVEQKKPPGQPSRICGFLWVYYGYPASSYEGINVEQVRYRCGAALARADTVKPDLVAGIPDSGTAHAIGYANEAGLTYCRPYVKFTPTWPRSFMPPNQRVRDLIARMKLIPIQEQISGKSLLFTDDSVVRGTQLMDTIQRLFTWGAREVHMRLACPPLIYGCKFLNFSRSKSELDLAARRAIREIEGRDGKNLKAYVREDSEPYKAMVETIRTRLGLTTLRYQRLADLLEAIGLPQDKVCTYCWNGMG